MYKRYKKYKPSGVEWIGEIPDGWDIHKLKNNLSGKLKYGANEPSGNSNLEHPRYIRITDFGNDGILKDDTFQSLPPDLAEEYLLTEGDVLFARSGATVGKTFLFKNFSGKACFAGYLIKATVDKDKLISNFLYYFTKSGFYEEWKNSVFIQATIQNIGADKYALLPIFTPPITEQTTIAHFLDQKTALIDRIISNHRKQIELLKEARKAIINQAVTKGINKNAKLKPSGIEWLGDIPEHWEVVKLKLLTNRIGDGLHSTPEYVDSSDYYFINGNNLKDGKIIINDSAKPVSQIEYRKHYIELDNRTILLSINGTIGSVSYYKGETVILGKSAAYIKCNDLVAVHFMFYIIQSTVILNYFLNEVTGATIFNLSLNSIRNTPIVLPPIEEQQSVVTYIEEKTAKINTIITKYEKQISLLEEYRTSLISKAVTGQIDVRGWKPPKTNISE